MPRQQRQQQHQPTQTKRLKCPLCGGKHHASDCDASLNGMIASALQSVARKCERCNAPTLGGAFCVECTLDRALERILDANQTQRR